MADFDMRYSRILQSDMQFSVIELNLYKKYGPYPDCCQTNQHPPPIFPFGKHKERYHPADQKYLVFPATPLLDKGTFTQWPFRADQYFADLSPALFTTELSGNIAHWLIP